MSVTAALPPWLEKAVEEAGNATVILKAGDRPYVIRSKAPYHIGTQPLTNLALEALAQQLLSEDAQQALYDGENVQETLPTERAPVVVRAVRMDHDIVIRLRAQDAPKEAPPPPPSPAAAESVTVLINRQTLALNEGRPLPPLVPQSAPVADPPPPAEPAVVEAPLVLQRFVVQDAGGAVVVEAAGSEPTSEIELPSGPEGLDTFISKLGPRSPAAPAPVDVSEPVADNVGDIGAGVESEVSYEEPAVQAPDDDQASDREPEAAVYEVRQPLAVATADLNDWIREGMDLGATALYLRVGHPPVARIDGRIANLASELVPTSMFEAAGPRLAAGEDGWRPAGEWAWSKEIPGTGVIRCKAFSDEHGGGLTVHLPIFVRGLDQHVPRHIQTACETGDGLIVIAAPFAEDVAAMVGAVVGWTAKRRTGFVVAFGFDAGLQSAAGASFVSARPMPPTNYEMTTALEGALQERPDTLVFLVEDRLAAADAIVSAAVGRLVVIGVVARTAPRALDALFKDIPGDRRPLATAFLAGCSWRRFRRPGAEPIVVSDVLVASESVRGSIEAADIAALHQAQASEQNHMRTIDAALASATTRDKITLREAAAWAVDRKTLVGLVRRQTWDRRRALRTH